MKRVLVTLAVAGGLLWMSQTAAFAQAPNAACNLLPPQERALCNQRINERRAACARQATPQAQQACLNAFNQLTARLNSCPQVQPADRRDDCVRAALGLRPPAPPVAAACNLLPPNERAACNQRINERRAACGRQATPQAQQACLQAFNALTARLNSCPRVQPADRRDDCVRAALGMPQPQAGPAACNAVTSTERPLCVQRYNERRAACARQATPQAQQACLASLNNRLNACQQQPPDRRDDCVRAAVGMPSISVSACNLLPPNEREACSDRLNARRAACERQTTPQARQACLTTFGQLNTRLNNCRTVQPADRRDDCVRAALGLRPAGPAAELGNVNSQLNSLRNRGRSLCNQLPPAQRPACVRSLYPPAPPTN